MINKGSCPDGMFMLAADTQVRSRCCFPRRSAGSCCASRHGYFKDLQSNGGHNGSVITIREGVAGGCLPSVCAGADGLTAGASTSDLSSSATLTNFRLMMGAGVSGLASASRALSAGASFAASALTVGGFGGRGGKPAIMSCTCSRSMVSHSISAAVMDSTLSRLSSNNLRAVHTAYQNFCESLHRHVAGFLLKLHD